MPPKINDHRQTTAVDDVLLAAADADEVVVIYLTNDGDLEVRSTMPYPPDILWALMVAQGQVMDINAQLDS